MLLLIYELVTLSEEDLREELEVWSLVCALDLGRRQERLVTIHIYNLRHAKTYLVEIKEKHLMQQWRL